MVDWLPVMIVHPECQPLLVARRVDENRAAAAYPSDHAFPEMISYTSRDVTHENPRRDLKEPASEDSPKRSRDGREDDDSHQSTIPSSSGLE